MKKTRIITVASGKGGVGKTNISVNLALYFAGQGYRTCLFDADLGLANTNILLGIYPERTLGDVISLKAGMADIVVRDYEGIDIIPGGSGIQALADLEKDRLEALVNSFSALEGYDFLLFDTSAGISGNVVSFCMTSSDLLLVVSPEPTSLTDGYALLKVLAKNGFRGDVRVVVNQVKRLDDAKRVFSRFRQTVHKFLPVRVQPGGTVVADEHVVYAVRAQRPFFLEYPDSDASKCIRNIGRYLIRKQPAEGSMVSMEVFWSRCLKQFEGGLHLGREKDATPPVAPDPPPTDPADGPVPGTELHALLGRLVEQVSSISGELRSIRKVLESNGDQGR